MTFAVIPVKSMLLVDVSFDRICSILLAMCLLGSQASSSSRGVRMAIRQRIGLRQVRALKPGETVWDASLSGFGARRQKSDKRGPATLVHNRAAWRTVDPGDSTGRSKAPPR